MVRSARNARGTVRLRLLLVRVQGGVPPPAEEFWNPDKTQFWSDAGVDLVIDRREGYLIWDMAGRRLIDMHLNGGTYNLGHRNPEVIAAVAQAMHASTSATTTSRRSPAPRSPRRSSHAPAEHAQVMYGVRRRRGDRHRDQDRPARHASGARSSRSSRPTTATPGWRWRPATSGSRTLFLSDRPDEFVQVPFNDLDAMEEALRGGDVAARDHETIPATYGFPLPDPGYLQAVKRLCERYGALYIADEVQTGLMRTGEMWGVAKAGIEPDIMIIGKGITGGMYPIACALVSEECSALAEGGRLRPHLDRSAAPSSAASSALKVLEICGRPEVRSMVHYIAERFRRGLRRSRSCIPTGSSASARTAS